MGGECVLTSRPSTEIMLLRPKGVRCHGNRLALSALSFPRGGQLWTLMLPSLLVSELIIVVSISSSVLHDESCPRCHRAQAFLSCDSDSLAPAFVQIRRSVTTPSIIGTRASDTDDIMPATQVRGGNLS